eukprot:6788760-Prymnesium_polylepis.1
MSGRKERCRATRAGAHVDDARGARQRVACVARDADVAVVAGARARGRSARRSRGNHRSSGRIRGLTGAFQADIRAVGCALRDGARPRCAVVHEV